MGFICATYEANRSNASAKGPPRVVNIQNLSHPDDVNDDNEFTVTHPDEICQYMYYMGLSHPGDLGQYRKSPRWHTAVSIGHSDEIRPGAKSFGWLKVWITLCHPDGSRCCPMSSGWHNVIWTLSRMSYFLAVSHPDDLWPMQYISSGWDIKPQYAVRMT